MCCFVYGQNTPVKSKKAPKPKQGKVTQPVRTVIDSATIVPNDSNMLTLQVEEEPEDTTPMRISKDAISAPVKYTARDSMPYDALNKTFYLYGEAKVTQGDLTLEADFIKIELEKNLVTAMGTKDTAGNLIGKPVFKQAGTEYRAERIKYNFKTKKGYLSEFRTKEGEGYIHGHDVAKDEDNNFGIEDAKYTTCNLDSPHYHIAATRIKVIPEKKVITGPANLQIEHIPTPLVLPFGIFSIKRGQASGVIVPTYGSSDDRGYFLRDGGYYFGLGEHLDYRLTGSIYTNQSWALNNGIRYSNRYHFGGDIVVNYAYNRFNEELDPGFRISKDFVVQWNHRSDPKAVPGSSFTANVNVSSVNDLGSSYFANNSYNPSNIVTNQLNSSIAYNKSFKGGKYNLSTTARMSQNTATRAVTLSLPDINFNITNFAPFKPKYKSVADKWYENITMSYTTSFRNSINTKDSILFRSWSSSEFARFYDTAGSYGMVHSVPIQTSFKIMKFYTLSTSLSLQEYWYGQTIRKDTLNGSVVSRNVNGFERAFTFEPRVGLNTRYYGIKNFARGKISAIRHVAIPTVGFSYTPDYSDASWGYYRSYTNAQGQEVKYSIFERGIAGGPGAGRRGNVEFSLDNNLEMKVRRGKDTAMKEEKIQIFETFRVGGAYNLFADSLNLSKINISARTKLFKNISVNATANMDPYVNEISTLPAGTKIITRINTFYWNKQRSLGLITDGSVGVNATFNRDVFKSKTSTKKRYEGELKYMNDAPGEYYDFNVPWNLNVNYSINYNKFNTLNDPTGTNFTQTLNFSGDVNLTSQWKIGYSSGYDIQNKQLTFTSIDFVRQLHCWEFKLNWIPIGFRQSFLFTINVKSSLLQDLKMTRRRDWFDRQI
ncbi:MAG: putative LPS assembly protein LptD [Bacteroidota bacterium]